MEGAPYDVGFFETIVGVHFGNLYLVVVVNGSNQSFSLGPYPPAPAIGAAAISTHANKDSVELLDTFAPPVSNDSTTGFIGCFRYLTPNSPTAAWIAANIATGGDPITSSPVNGACTIPPDPLAVAEIDFTRSVEVTTFYLFSIPAGEDVVTATVEGIVANFDSGLDTGDYSQTTTGGSGLISVSVYSTVKGKITKLEQLIDFFGDGKPRPTEDDNCTLTISSANQGAYKINVELDKDKADAQIDNYGKTFQPYKVTLTPDIATDNIPSQPPIRLG
jgi:hypothetical protein